MATTKEQRQRARDRDGDDPAQCVGRARTMSAILSVMRSRTT